MRIPFCPISIEKARKLVGTTFYGVVEPFLKVSPGFELQLKQAGIPLNGREYLSIAMFSAFFMFLLIYFVFLLFTIRMIELIRALSMSFIVSGFFFLVTFFYIKIYPNVLIKKKVLDLERNLLYALRHMYVQITSGVPIFDAIVSLSEGNYGAVSKELKIAVKDVNTGTPVEVALERVASKNPSQYLRRTIWQISNGIKSGGDIGNVLKNIIDYISSEQRIAIRRYGAQLNPLTLAYMMVAVIMPSLGVTFLIVLSSFTKIPVTKNMFYVILIFLAIFQFMFMGIIKSKRPNLL
jgi:flagellar protein FlaJ